MKPILNVQTPIGNEYPTHTGRLKQVIGAIDPLNKITKVALFGDSTLDNGYWVEQGVPYIQKTHTVTHQAAVALAKTDNSKSYEVANFAVDGATTTDLQKYCYLNKVLPEDDDHPSESVHQINELRAWKPNVAVLSVAGNNYREALFGTLRSQLSYPQLLFRMTPEQARPTIKQAFAEVKRKLLKEYKAIIDEVTENNPDLSRLVLMSQYYPSITEFTPYFIYTGFSHVARSEDLGQDMFTAMEETMNELYREVLKYAATKDKEIVFVDVTSSLNPLDGNHTHQIEPNEKGSVIMGRLIAGAVNYEYPDGMQHHVKKQVALLRLDSDEHGINSELLNEQSISVFKVKKIEQYISENRYRHLSLFFSSSSNLSLRFESAYHAVVGKQFDSQYTGVFAFGLLDVSLITIAASYLWRAALNDNLHLSLRIAAGVVAAPILLSKMILGLAVMLVLSLPILAYHQAFYSPLGTVIEPGKAIVPENESDDVFSSFAPSSSS